MDYEKLYVEWFNNYLTVDKFAEDYDLTLAEARHILDEGRRINHDRT